MNRIVEPEILDELSPQDTEAIKARHDLRRVNFVMGNARLLHRTLRELFPVQAPKKIAELGAGDGTLLLEVARKTTWRGVQVTFVDRQRAITEATLQQFRELGWEPKFVQSDVFQWLSQPHSHECIIANLFLHHFEAPQLKALLADAARGCKAFVACEPPRSRRALLSCRLLRLIGCGRVVQVDAAISVRAGFAGTELSQLWPGDSNWELSEGVAGLFNHLFVARRRGTGRETAN
jgi:2-polyprenyl-3-methyl-5-hydroxy-6-metoxy-1,4-benzoquinol methylase